MFSFPKSMLIAPKFQDDYTDNQDIASCCVPIDQYDAESFNINDFGYIRNDISQLARAQSVQEYDLIMKRLQVLTSKGDVPKDVKPQEAISRVRSRYLQSPNELLSYAEQLANGDLQKLHDSYKEALKDVKVTEHASVPTPEQAPETN